MCDLNLSSPLSHPVLPPLLHVCPQFRVCWGLGSTLPLDSPQGKYLRQGLPEWGEAVQGLSKSKVPKGLGIWGEYGTGSPGVFPLLRTWDSHWGAHLVSSTGTEPTADPLPDAGSAVASVMVLANLKAGLVMPQAFGSRWQPPPLCPSQAPPLLVASAQTAGLEDRRWFLAGPVFAGRQDSESALNLAPESSGDGERGGLAQRHHAGRRGSG